MESIAHAIIRPRRCFLLRDTYNPETDLGPTLFHLQGTICRRRDLEVRLTQITNPRGFILKCSWFEPFQRNGTFKPPCIVYCHGNCGTRLDSFDIVETLIPMGISVFAFDFAGSGLSGGKYVTLGYFEQEDIRVVVAHLRTTEGITSVSLWGRSMGAASAILYAATDPQVHALVLDSPFTSLTEVSKDMIQSYKYVPSSFAGPILQALRKRIKNVAEFDIEEVSPIKVISKCRMPCAFIHSVEDTVVNLSHSVRLFDQYPNLTKIIIKIPGGHNTKRPRWLNEEAAVFIKNLVLPTTRGGHGNRTMFEHRVLEMPKSPMLPPVRGRSRNKSAFHVSLPPSPVPSSPGVAVVKTTKEMFSSSRRGSLLVPMI